MLFHKPQWWKEIHIANKFILLIIHTASHAINKRGLWFMGFTIPKQLMLWDTLQRKAQNNFSHLRLFNVQRHCIAHRPWAFSLNRNVTVAAKIKSHASGSVGERYNQRAIIVEGKFVLAKVSNSVPLTVKEQLVNQQFQPGQLADGRTRPNWSTSGANSLSPMYKRIPQGAVHL